jgi:N-acetylneuraminic acid mutarotase
MPRRNYVHFLPMLWPVALVVTTACGDSHRRDLTGPDPQTETVGPQSLSPLAAANTWVNKRSMLDPARFRVKAAGFNGIIYVVGGDAGVEPNRALRNLDAYNVATNTWSRRRQLPSGRSDVNGASVIGGKIYVTGGLRPLNGGYALSRTLFVYNPASDTWAKKANMPVDATRGAQGVIDGRLYVHVGSATPGDRVFFRYNPATDTWADRAAPPTQHIRGGAGVINGKFYLVGGEGGPDLLPTRTLSVYNPATNTWTTKAPMSQRRQQFATGVINGKLYVAGGSSDAGEALTATEVYDPATDRWTMKAPMLAEQAGMAGAVASGKLFVMGGFNNSSTTRKVQAFTP